MTNLIVKEYDLVNEVSSIKEEVFKEEDKKSNFKFFGNIDVSIREIDAAIKKLEQLSVQRVKYAYEDI
jgi:hypothetical protein